MNKENKHLKNLLELARKYDEKLDYKVEEVNPFPDKFGGKK